MLSHASDSLAKGYFNTIRETFNQAALMVGGMIDRQYQIGEQIIQLSFAGPALIPLITPAIEHLADASNSDPALTILLWDSETTGIEMPPAPWDVKDFVERGENWRFDNQLIRINFKPNNQIYNLIDMDEGIAIFRAATKSDMPQNESGSPLLQILKWWFDRNESFIIHASAVGKDEGGVLFVGKGGSGKSTTAMICLEANLSYVGDDYCLLADSNPPYVYSLYNSGKVSKNAIDRFTFLHPALSSSTFPDAEKALFFLNQHQSVKVLSGFQVKAVLIPQITGSTDTQLVSASPAQALLSLAPSTIFQFQRTENNAFLGMSKLVKHVPCYELRLGTDLSSIAEPILSLL